MEFSTDEAKRMANLYQFGILDSRFEDRFDRLTRIASAIFGTPIALISLVDKDRQWFKSATGLDVRQIARDISFCTHAIQSPEVFMVNDAHEDSRFKSNPLVTGDPHVRFYAGAPLISQKGYALGTFCVIDKAPRDDFSADQQQLLKDLAATVVDFFEMQLAIRQFRADERGAEK